MGAACFIRRVFRLVCGGILRTVNGAPLVELRGVIPGNTTRVLIGCRKLGINNSVGAHATLDVVRTTRTGNVVGGSAMVIRPADNGRNVNLSLVNTIGKCGIIVVVPSSMDRREHGLIGTCKTRLILVRSSNSVNGYVRRYLGATLGVRGRGPGI